MFKIIVLLFSTIFTFGLMAKVDITQSGNTLNYDFNIDGIIQKEITIQGKKFSRMKLEGIEGHEGIHYRLGLPEIPVIRFYAPAGKIKVSYNNNKNFQENKILKTALVPNLESLEKIPGAKRKLIMNKSFQKTNAFFPNKKYLSVPAGSIRGEKKQLVTIYPFTWNPALKTYKLVKNVSVSIETINSVKKNEGQATIAFIIGSIFKDSASIEKYKAYKETQGYKIIKLVISPQMQTDISIRKKLQDILRTDNLQHAIIFGDAEHVTSHRATNISGVTDHFYRAIDTDDYENDINGPDIGVGRITIKNETELLNVVDKLIKYQNGVFSNEEWLGNVSFIATSDRWQVAEGTHNHAITNYTGPHGYTGIFPTENLLGGDQLYAITHRVRDEQVVRTMNLGRTIINYSGHGATTYWAGPTVTQDDVRSLTHGDAIPFVISNACITGQFTVDESFGETWIKHPQGAIMFWGSMDSSTWDEDDILEKDMFKGIYELKYYQFNKITQYALKGVWQYYNGLNRSKYYWETYVTFGDPSIRLRTDYTKELTISGPEALPIGVPEAVYTVTDQNGGDVKNAQVVFSLNGNYISSGVTDEKGQIILKIPADQSEVTYTINVYGHNIHKKLQKLFITAADRPYVILSEFTIDGQEASKVTPFQQLHLGLKAKNVSRIETKGGTIQIAKIEGPATIISGGPITFPALLENQEFHYTGEKLAVQIEDALNNEKVTIHFKWTTTEGEEGHSSKTYKTARGISKVSAVDFGVIDNPEINGIKPGETGEVFITIQNSGNAPMENINLYPTAGNCVTILEGAIFIEKLSPGEKIRVLTPIKTTISDSCQNNDTANFTLEGNYGTCTQIDIKGNAKFIVGKYGQAIKEENLNLEVPDKTTVAHEFEFSGIQVVKDISLHVKITHPYIGDISIQLVHPNGTKITLRKKHGGSSDNIDEVFGRGGTEVPELSTLAGLPATGTWKLEITDHAIRDTGILTYMKATLVGLVD